MHVELVVPALFQAQLPPRRRWSCCSRAAGAPKRRPRSLEDWLGRAFGLGEGPLPAGALSALARGLEPGAGHWLRADPVHLRADRDRVLLIPSAGVRHRRRRGAVAVRRAEPRTLRISSALHAFAPGPLGPVRAVGHASCDARAPIEIAGRDIDAELPDKRWHALLNEIQMALYQHAVNTAREARGDPVVNGVWLWGAGALPAAAAFQAGPGNRSAPTDPVALGLAKLAGMRHRAPGAGAAAWLERAPEDGRHLVLLDGLRGAHALGDAEALRGGCSATGRRTGSRRCSPRCAPAASAC